MRNIILVLSIILLFCGCGTSKHRSAIGAKGDPGDDARSISIATICEGTRDEGYVFYGGGQWFGVDKHDLREFVINQCYSFRDCSFCIDGNGNILE